MKKSFLRYLIPGFVFQSVVIGGGYGTGAEITEYFAKKGMAGGLLAMLVTLVAWSVICAITFAFAQTFRTFDYSSMMVRLLGRFSILYELCYIAMMLMVLGVINATAGRMIESLTGLNAKIGILILSVCIVLLVTAGTQAVEKALSLWSWVLYAVYALFLLLVFCQFGGNICGELAKVEIVPGWFSSGMQYAFYNLGIVPALLYTVQEAENQREAVLCGALAGVIGVLPALLLLLAMGCDLATVVAAPLPIAVIFDRLDMNWMHWLFELVLFGTLIETGTGFIKALDDRMEVALCRSCGNCPLWMRALVAIAAVVVGISVSNFGLSSLIAKGYGTICWGFFTVYVLPLLTIGSYELYKQRNPNSPQYFFRVAP